MAESATAKSLSEDYLLKEIEEKLDVSSKSAGATATKEDVKADAPVPESPVEPPATPAVTESAPAPVESTEVSSAPATENVEAADNSEKDATEDAPAASEETTEQGSTDEETPEIKLETAPGDYRFPTTNQSRHCFTRYVEYHRCVAAKGEGASECDKFAKYYRSLCPGEWVDRWNEQRENGTFPGPL